MTSKDQQRIAQLQNRIMVLEQALSDIEEFVVDILSTTTEEEVEASALNISSTIERTLLRDNEEEEEEG